MKILLIEDNPADQRIIKELVREFTRIKFDLIIAERLSRGLEHLNDDQIGVILLDLNLPDSSGVDTFRTIYQQEENIPIVILTGNDDDAIALQAVQGGAQDFLIKGQIDSQRLQTAIHYAIERHRLLFELKKITTKLQKEIADRKQAEEEIRLLNATLEQRVRDRTQELEQATETIRASLDEKVILLREIHHRVKNNLQIILSLISLQSRNIKDQKILDTMGDFQNRIMAMAHVHERMFRAEDISRIDLSEIVTFLGTSLFASYNVDPQHIRLNVEMKDLKVTLDSAIPISLIINELISNSIRHGFPTGNPGEIFIAIQREDHTLTILFKDNGAGIPQDFDWRNARSLGLRLVISLVEQLEGTIELDRTAGTAFKIIIKEKE